MKKFTLSTVAVAGVMIASASVTHVAKVFSNDRENLQVAKTATNVSPIAEKNFAKCLGRIGDIDKAPLNKAVSRADEGTTAANDTVYTPSYLYPAGTLFPIWWVYQKQADGSYRGPVYMSLGNWHLPAGSEVEFTNFSVASDSTGVLDMDLAPLTEWEYNWGIYHSQYFQFYKSEKTNNLTKAFASDPRVGGPVDVPTITVADTSFCSGGLDYPDGILFGGKPTLNSGYENYYATKYGFALDKCYYKTYIANYNNASTLDGYSNNIGAGTDASAFYGDISCKDLREQMIGDEMTAAGVASGDFVGFAQPFTTTSAGGRLSRIGVRAYVNAAAEQSIDIALYKVVTEGEGENPTQSFTEVVAGSYTFETAVDTKTMSPYIDMYDEATEKDYIELDPNSQYLVMITGVDALGAFVPTLPKMEFDINDLGSLLGPDRMARAGVYSVFVKDDAYRFIDCDVNWKGSTVSKRKYFPAMNVELDITYPYVQGVASFQTETNYARLDGDEASVDVKIFDYEGTPVALLILHSDAPADDLLKTVEYSSESLKDLVAIKVTDDQPFTHSILGEMPLVRRIVMLAPKASIPAGSSIKFNYGKGFTLNLPEYTYSGVGTVVADTEVVATECFDLAGRKVAADAQGLMIQKVTMADGTVKAVKVVK